MDANPHASKKDVRTEDRLKMQGDFPGVLLHPETGIRVPAMMRDISTHGLGLLLNQEFDVGTEIKCSMGEKEVELELCWIEPFGYSKGLYSVGLKSKEIETSLLNIKRLQK